MPGLPTYILVQYFFLSTCGAWEGSYSQGNKRVCIVIFSSLLPRRHGVRFCVYHLCTQLQLNGRSFAPLGYLMYHI